MSFVDALKFWAAEALVALAAASAPILLVVLYVSIHIAFVKWVLK